MGAVVDAFPEVVALPRVVEEGADADADVGVEDIPLVLLVVVVDERA